MLEDVLLSCLLAQLFRQIEDQLLHLDSQNPSHFLVLGIEYPLVGIRIMRRNLGLVAGSIDGEEFCCPAHRFGKNTDGP